MIMPLGLTAPFGAGAGRNVATCFLSSELPPAGECHPSWVCPAPCPLTKCFINPGFGAGGRPWPPRPRGHTCPPTCSLPPAPTPQLSLELGLLRQGRPPALGSLLPSPVLGPRRAHTCCLFIWSLCGHPSGRPQPVCGVWGRG